MKKSYLFVYDDKLGTREEVKEAINTHPIITWRYDIPHCFYLVSEASAKEISALIRSKLPAGRFVVSEVDSNYWGHTTTDTWYLIKNKVTKPKE